VLLGADMPLADLPLAAKRSQSAAIVLSGSLEPDAQMLAEQLPALVAAAGVPVFIGGLTQCGDATRSWRPARFRSATTSRTAAAHRDTRKLRHCPLNETDTTGPRT